MRNSSEIMSDVFLRTDGKGLLVQKDGDAGDSAYRSAIFAYLLHKLRYTGAQTYYDNMIKQLSVMPGILRRTSNVNHWGSNPNNFSRDQAAAVMLAASAFGDNKTVNTFYENCYKRSELKEVPVYGNILHILNEKLSFIGFHQNVHPGTDAADTFRKVPDPIGLGETRNEIRRKRQWLLYPFLMLKDMGFFLDLVLRKYQSWDFDSLLAKDLMYSQESMPTIFSYLAIQIYKKTDYLEKIRENYSDKNNGIEPLGELYELVCRRFLNNEEVK